MSEIDTTFLELAQELKRKFSTKPKKYPYFLAGALCEAIQLNRTKDTLLLLNLMKEYLAEHNLSYLLDEEPEPEEQPNGAIMVQDSLFNSIL